MKNSNIKIGTNKSFGIVFFVVFLLIGFYPLLNDDSLRWWAIIVSVFFLLLGFLNSVLLTPLNSIWFKFGLFLGKFVSPIVMGLVYFAVVFPTFLFLKLLKKNYLNIKYEKNKLSYWMDVKDKNKSMKDQF